MDDDDYSDSDDHYFDGFDTAMATPCEGSTPGWVDSIGNGCSWYEMFDSPGCHESESYVGPMGPVTENCCYCWMDVQSTASCWMSQTLGRVLSLVFSIVFYIL